MSNITWLEEWLQLFPKEVQSGGMSIQSPAKYCVNKMVKFVKDHPQYTKDIIFAATERYLAERKQENYNFTKRATYFISKVGEESVLEAFCEKVIKLEKAKYPLTPDQCLPPTYNAIDDYI